MYIQIAHRIKFHIYSWRENLFARLIQREDGKRWKLGFFNGHSFFFYQIELNLYSCYSLFPLCFKNLFILFIDQCFTSFSHQLFAFIFVLQRTFYFSFSSLVLSVTRSEYLSRHFQKVSSKRYRFRNNIFPLYKLKCFVMSIRWQRNFCNLEKILDFCEEVY